MAPHGDDDHYHPVDSVKAGITGAMTTGGAGILAAGVQNALRKQNVGALAVATRSGGLIFTWSMYPFLSSALSMHSSLTDVFCCHLAAVGGAFEFTRNAAANLRQKKDHYNAGIGGFLAGSILGMKGMSYDRRTVPVSDDANSSLQLVGYP